MPNCIKQHKSNPIRLFTTIINREICTGNEKLTSLHDDAKRKWNLSQCRIKCDVFPTRWIIQKFTFVHHQYVCWWVYWLYCIRTMCGIFGEHKKTHMFLDKFRIMNNYYNGFLKMYADSLIVFEKCWKIRKRVICDNFNFL